MSEGVKSAMKETQDRIQTGKDDGAENKTKTAKVASTNTDSFAGGENKSGKDFSENAADMGPKKGDMTATGGK